MVDIERVPQIPPMNPASQFRPPVRDAHSRSARRPRQNLGEDRVEIEGEEPEGADLPAEEPPRDEDGHVDFRA